MRSTFTTARARLRRQTQDVVHYSAPIDDAYHDIEQADEPTPTRRADIVREIAAHQHVTVRRAQQIVKSQIERTQIVGDLFGFQA